MADENSGAEGEHLNEEPATSGASNSGKDPAAEAIETLKALAPETAKVVVAKVLEDLPHKEAKIEIATSAAETLPEDAVEAKTEIATKVVETLPDDATDAKKQIATKAVQEASSSEAKKEIATSVVEALPEDATEVKKEVATSAVHTLPDGAAEAKTEIAKEALYALPDDAVEHKKEIATSVVENLPEGATEVKKVIAASVVESLPDGAVAAKTEIATDAVNSLPDHATEAKKEIVKESVQDLSPEFRDYLITDLVTMRRLFRRVFVWTVFGAFAVALVVVVFTAVGTTFWGSEQIQNLLWVAVPVATLLLGYGFGRAHSEQADIKHLREQNHESGNGSR